MISGKSWQMPRKRLSWLFAWAYPDRAKQEAERRLARQLERIEIRRQSRIRMRNALSDEDFLQAMNILKEGGKA